MQKKIVIVTSETDITSNISNNM